MHTPNWMPQFTLAIFQMNESKYRTIYNKTIVNPHRFVVISFCFQQKWVNTVFFAARYVNANDIMCTDKSIINATFFIYAVAPLFGEAKFSTDTKADNRWDRVLTFTNAFALQVSWNSQQYRSQQIRRTHSKIDQFSPRYIIFLLSGRVFWQPNLLLNFFRNRWQ